MKTKMWTLFVIMFFSTFASLYPQDNTPTRILVLTDVVYPYKADQYEKAQKDMNQFLVKNFPTIKMTCLQFDQYVYNYIVMVKDFAAIDEFNKMWQDKMKTINQDEFKTLSNAFTGTISKNTQSVYMKDEKGSYKAQNPYVDSKDANFYHYDYYEIIPGKEEDALQVAHDLTALDAKLNLRRSHTLWRPSWGGNTNSLLLVTSDKSAAEFYTNQEKERQSMDQGRKDLGKKFMTYIQKFEHWNGKPRPELSINSESTATK